MKLNLSADEVLTTTRSVRKRLDLGRPVPRQVLLECLNIALQAPTGSFSQGWQWVFVEDAAKKRAIADLYGTHYDAYAQQSRLAQYPDDDLRGQRRAAIRSSSTYLREHFHEVPVLMIPCIQGRLDGVSAFQAASAWGSILPAVWSFMLALRERGLGSAWTTLHLPSEREVAEIIGIPYEQYTQAGLFPIAYTVGTEFKAAPRLALDGLVHFDTW